MPDPPPAPPAWEAAATTDAGEPADQPIELPPPGDESVEDVAGTSPSEIEEMLDEDDDMTDPAEVFDDIDGEIGNHGDTRRDTGGQA
jgi:hypothetical protein